MNLAEKLKDELNWRGILKDIANYEELNKIISLKSKFYVGFDATADSLHIGHYISIITSKLVNKITGMEPVFVIGGLTSQIGDPSGKNVERVFMERKVIEENVEMIKHQINQLAKKLNIEKFEIFDNMDVYKDMSIVDFFQKYGKNFNLNSMIAKDMVKNRLSTGISYTEFSYQVFQAIDFFTLFDKKNVRFQIGGSDQWGNIVSGIELIRKIKGSDENISGLTIELLLDENGNKIGKTGGNAIWLNNDKFSSFEMYQYLINVSDILADTLLSRLTLISKEEHSEIKKEAKKNPKEKLLQKEVAKRIISNIHDEKSFEKVYDISKILFSEEYSKLEKYDFSDIEKYFGENQVRNYEKEKIGEFLLNKGILNSRRELREFHLAKAIKINGNIVLNLEEILDEKFLLREKYLILNVGKKNKYLIIKK